MNPKYCALIDVGTIVIFLLYLLARRGWFA